MFAHLEKYNLNISYSSEIKKKISEVRAVLNKDFPDNQLNIIGTSNCSDVQIYGWKSPVPMHCDGTGYILFMPISINSNDFLIDHENKLELKVGSLYLLDDRKLHGTLGLGNVVSLFMGSFHQKQLNEELYQSVFHQFKDYVLRATNSVKSYNKSPE